jgi:N4-gp56 family major capsid protein
MAAETTSTLTNEMQIYYESRFLERSKKKLVHRQGAQKQTHGKNQGKVIRFNRYTPLSDATTPLTEGSNPAEVSIASTTVDVSLAEYGNTVKVSKLLNLTSIDKQGEEKSDLLGQNMGETLDTLCREAMYSGATAQLAGGKAHLSLVAATDVYNYTEIRKAVRTLTNNNAPEYEDGFYMGKIGPMTRYDILNDSTWVNAKTYSDVKDLYEGEVGELGGVRHVISTNQKTESSTVTVYNNFIHGAQAFGEYELEGDMPKLYIKVPTASDTSNPADRYSTMAWAGVYAAKVLIAQWILSVKTGASA